MIIDVNAETLSRIKNPSLASYASIYTRIYEDFIEQIRHLGIEIDPHSYRHETAEAIKRLKAKGATLRNDDKSIVVNRLSPACIACQKGVGSATFFISLKCHRSCFYCFNPNQENYDFFCQHKRNLPEELEELHFQGQQVSHLALTGGEPLLFKEDAVDFFTYARERFPTAYKRLYTCGDHVDAETLEQLREADLDEIRFSIRMHDLEKGHRHVFDRIALAKAHIPHVMVEMPVLPGTLDIMQDVLLELDRLNIDSINLLEFCFPWANAPAFNAKGYQIKQRPYRVLYNYWYAGGLPVARSELECLALLEFAIDRQLRIGVHYCSLENKHTGQIYQQNFGQPIPRTMCFSEKDYFLKSAKVFGADIPLVVKRFRRMRYDEYVTNDDYGYVEFHLSKIKSLRELDIEIGLSSSVLEVRDEEPYLRELKVDLAYPRVFDFATDV